MSDIFAEFKAEFQSFKDDMNKGFSNVEKTLSSVECQTDDMVTEIIIFEELAAKAMNFFVNAQCFIVGVLIAFVFFHNY